MVRETGCDAVMIGRAAATNPWIFRQMAQYAESGRYDTPTEDDRHQLLSGYYRQICAANLPDGIGKMKQFACWFTHGVGNGSELRRIVHAARTPSEVVEKVETFFESRAAAEASRSQAGPHVAGLAVGEIVACSAGAHGVDRFAVTHENTRTVAEDPSRVADARKEDPAHGPFDADTDRLEATLGA